MELSLDQALQKGIEAHKAGKVQEADRYYTAILKANSKHPDANHNMGVLAVGVDKVQEALPFFKTALEANPSIAQFWLSYIDALVKLDRSADAKAVLNQAKERKVNGRAFDRLEQKLHDAVPSGLSIPINQDPPQEELQRLINLYNKSDFQKALDGASILVNQFPRSFILHNLCGAIFAEQKQYDRATVSFENAIKFKPNNAEAYNNLGVVLKEQSKFEEALTALGKALLIQPEYAEAHNNIGNTFKEQGKFEEALGAFKRALEIKPYFAEAIYNMGVTLNEQGELDGATQAYEKAIHIKPDYAEAYNNLGNTLNERGKLGEAIEAYQKVLKLKPDYAKAYNNLGNTFHKIGNLEEAIKAYQKAIEIKPTYTEVYLNMGVSLTESYKLEEAIEVYIKALKIDPNCAEVFNNLGIALKGIKFTTPNPELQVIINSLLVKYNFVRPIDISKTAISLLKFEAALQNLFQKRSNEDFAQKLPTIISELSYLPLLLTIMSLCPLADLELEKGLRDIRSAILFSITKITASPRILHFQSALALQCFTNEYLYNQSQEETRAIQSLEELVKKTLLKGQQPTPQSLLCLASYKALNEYEWCDLIRVEDEISEVFTRQILEPQTEFSLKKDIPALRQITNKVSAKVREQYEENPYPDGLIWASASNLALFQLKLMNRNYVY
jgi:tetratricopeptide (TPR) repeat protein